MKKVFIGLLTFSLGAYIALSFINVFAFTNPSANPPAGNVAPVFSSVNINNGGLVMDNDADTINGRFRANFDPTTATTTIGGSTFSIDSIATLFTNNAGFQSGLGTNTITPYLGINSAPIRIRGATSVENTLNVWNDISNSTANSAGAVSINDALNVTGNISNSGGDVSINDNLTALNFYDRGNLTVDGTTVLGGNIQVRQPIANSAGVVDVNDDLSVAGNLHNVAGDLTMDDKVVMKKNVDIWGTIATPDASLDINSNLWVTGVINSTVSLVAPTLNVTNPIENTSNNHLTLRDDGIDVNVLNDNVMTINGTGDAIGSLPSGILNIRNGARGVVFDQNEIMSIGGTLYINDEGSQNVVIGNAVAPSNLTVYGALNSSTSIGRFYSTEVFTAIAANSTDIASAVCEAGDFRIACSGSTSNMDNLVFHGAWLSGDRTCTARLKNKNNAVANIYARAYCFSPNG